MTDADIDVPPEPAAPPGQNQGPARSRPGPAGIVTVTDLLRVVRRRWPAVLAGVLLGLVATLGYLSVVPPTYAATTEVALRLPVVDAFSYPGTGADRVINMNVEESLAASGEVIDSLAELTGRPHQEVREALTVESPVGGQKLRFRYTAPDRDQARLGADQAAAAYLELRRNLYDQERVALVADYDESIAQAEEDLADTQDRIDDLPPPVGGVQSAQTTAALAELTSLRGQLAQLREEQARIRSVDVTPGWVTRPADERPGSGHDRLWLWLAAGLAGGALLGGGAALAWESTDRRIRSTAAAAEATGLPLLGLVRRRRSQVSAVAVDADVRYASYALATQVADAGQLLVLVSPREDEGRTRLVAALALALAAGGRDVHLASLAGRTAELRAAVLADRDRFGVPQPAPPVWRGDGGDGGDGADRSPPDRTSGPDAAPPGAATSTPAGSPNGGLGHDHGADGDDLTALPAVGQDSAPARRLRAAGVALAESPVSATGGRPPLIESIPVGSGVVRLRGQVGDPAGALMLVDAPPAELSAQGVIAARDGSAVVVAARDRTRVPELRRLVDRLHSIGADPVGIIVTRS